MLKFGISAPAKKAPRGRAVFMRRALRADLTAALACGTQRTPLDRTCSKRTASVTFPH